MPALKEWQPKKRFSHKDGKWHLAFAHRASLKGKNDRSKNLTLIVLYQRKYTKHLYSGLPFEELPPLLGPTVSANYVENRLIRWVEWGFLKREPSINPGTHKLIYLYTIDERGRNMVENIIPRQKLAEYVQVLISAHKLLLTQKEEKPNDNVK
jgi:hypothetical protein